ncbi:MAG: hypothetical protein E7294_12430 [Lachnospiraceae bacterium]|jgi:putative membrane protein|nr:hypothetical protein [Lachnospiraceae bacterium]
MKKKEILSMLHKKNIMRAAALVLAASVFVSGVNVYDIRATEKAKQEEEKADEEENLLTKMLDKSTGSVSRDNTEAGKEETVYVISDATGKPTETIVSDWLKNPEGADIIKDASDLQDIENVKGDEAFEAGSGNSITWDADGSDIYYQGKTTKEAPVDVKITYFLNDKEISPQEIAGKSGKVKIRLDYSNREKQTIKVGDKEEEVYVPFAVVSGMILPVDNFTNVSVQNGKVISEGNNQIVVGLAFPGLKDSLAMEKKESDIEIPEYVEVTANAEDFKLSMTLSVAMSDILDTVDIDADLDFDDISGKMDELTDATGKLLDGSDQLKNGAGALKDGMDSLKNGTSTLANGANTLNSKKSELTNGAGQLSSGINEYTSGVGQLAGGIGSLKDGTSKLKKNVPALLKGVDQLKSGSASAKNGADQLLAGYEGSDGKPGAVDGAKQVAAGVSQLASSLGALTGSMSQTVSATEQQYVDSANTSLSALGLSVSTDPASIQAAINSINGLKAQATAGLSQIDTGIGNCDTAIATYTQMGDAETAAGYQAQKDQLTGQKAGVEAQIAQLDGAAGSLNQLLGMIQALEGVKGQLGAGVSADQQASIQALVAGANSLSDGIQQLYAGTKALDSGLGELDNGLGKLQSSGKTLSSGVSKLDDGASQLKTGAKKLTDNSAALVNGGASLAAGAGQVANAIGQIADGATRLDNGAGQLKDGAGKLKDGTTELSDGMNRFNEEGIEKITDTLSSSGDVTEFFDRIKAVKDAGKDYQTFSGLAAGAKGNVKFIIKTDAVKEE